MADVATPGSGAPVDLRAEILADLAPKPDAPVEAAPVVDEQEADDAADDTDLEASADADNADDDLVDDADASTDADAVDAEPTDPAAKKSLDQIRRTEKHMRAKLDADRAAFDVDRESHKAALAEVEQFKALGKRAKYDPVGLLKAFGVTADDFEIIAQSIYAESPALQADPKQKAAAMAKLKARETEDKYTALEKKQAELEAKIEQAKKDAAMQAEVASYVQQINTTAQKFPLVAAMLKADPDDTNDALVKTYDTLGRTLRRAPKPSEVIASFDKASRAKLAKLGIDPDTITKAKPVVKIPPAAAKPGAKPVVAAKPAANSNGTKKTDAELREEILADISTLS